MSAKLVAIPLSKLQRSPDNIRKTDSAADLQELAASIASLGVLQNLTVRPVPKPNGKGNGMYEVTAGGRRLAALQLLVKRRKIKNTYPVPCVVREDDATEVSLAENVIRAPVHPADQFDAFSKLHADGMGVEDIAARFGITAKVVEQRLKLASVSPKLMAVYREGGMTLDQLVAFTITDDHTAQEYVWFEAPLFDRSPQSLRQMLTRSLVEGGDRRARFVGAEAYEAAGGTLVRDLFRTDDEAYFTDSVLLDRLVGEKLAAEAEAIRSEGWAWVEVIAEPDPGYYSRFRHLSPSELPLSEEEEAHVQTLSTRHDELIEELDEDGPEELRAELDRVAEELEEIAARRECWSAEQKAEAGAVVSLDYDGKLLVHRGLAKRETGAARSEQHAPGTSGNGKSAQSRPQSELSDRLVEDLSAHRTAALREALAARPDTANAALLCTLVQRVFFGAMEESCVDIRPVVVDLRPSSERISESKAAVAMAERHKAWLKRLPELERLWQWVLEQTEETRSELLAYCVACTVNAVRQRRTFNGERLAQADTLAAAVGLDMAAWWEPTKERYLSSVSKAHVLAAVREAVSPQAADNISGMKKDAMIVRAEELLAGRRWLPAMLRTPVPLAVPEQPES